MCTLAVLFRPSSPWPLVVAANRDEKLDRPSSGPRLWQGPIPFLAPLDERAGGSWLGLNGRGLFVGITNRFGAPTQDARHSRGQLVLEALAAPSAAGLHASLASLSPERFNAFHLLYADPRSAFVTWSDGITLTQQTLSEGLHVVTERSLGGDDRARSERVRAAWPAADLDQAPTPAQLMSLLALHAEDPLGGTCVHAPLFGYGTRSSAVLLVGRDLRATQLYWAEGPPCRTPFLERPELVKSLLGAGPA